MAVARDSLQQYTIIGEYAGNIVPSSDDLEVMNHLHHDGSNFGLLGDKIVIDTTKACALFTWKRL